MRNPLAVKLLENRLYIFIINTQTDNNGFNKNRNSQQDKESNRLDYAWQCLINLNMKNFQAKKSFF